MNIVAVDNSAADLSQFVDIVTTLLPKSKIQVFTDPLLSAKYICNNPVDLVFVADVMRPANGFKLMRVLRVNIPKLPIVMMLADSMNQANALEAEANAFLVKPISPELLSGAINRAML